MWLRNVVVLLYSSSAAGEPNEINDHSNQDSTDSSSTQFEAAIAEAVRFAHQGSTTRRSAASYGIIVSLARVVLLRIKATAMAPTVGGGGVHGDNAHGGATPPVVVVEHSNWLLLLALRPLALFSHTRRPAIDTTFSAVAHHFDGTASAALTRATTSAGALPDGVLEHLIVFADLRTRRAMARASVKWAQYAATRVTLRRAW
jgi:hypothetical protein